MADKSINELVAAEQITATDMFVLEQNNTAKKLTGQILLNWLTKAADGHGGISSIEKLSTSVLTDTYRITLADTTTFDFPVENGKGISGIAKQSTSGLTDTYKISYNDGTYTTFPVTNGRGIKSWTESVSGLTHTYTITYNDNSTSTIQVKDGEKGDKGDNAYLWIKYASQEPTASSHNMSDIPDNWIGVYAGNSATAPTDYTQYQWFQLKGEKGDTGAPAVLNSSKVEYQVSDSGTIIPSGSWSTSVPVVAQGKYLWTRTTQTYNTGDPVVSYSIGRMGLDGSGSVSSVAGVSPDSGGNVLLTAADVGALPSTGGDLTGELKMNGQPISGLNPPTENTQAANKGYVDNAVSRAAPANLLDNSDFCNPVNQRGVTSGSATDWVYTLDRWEMGQVAYALVDEGLQVTPINESSEHIVFQYMDNALSKRLLGKTITFAVWLSDGSAHVSAAVVPAAVGWGSILNHETDNVTLEVCWDSSGTMIMPRILFKNKATVSHIALYEGEYTADTLPEYHPKGYAAELAECQRYFHKLTGTNARWATGMFNHASLFVAPFYLPVPMRVTPTIKSANIGIFRSGSTIIEAGDISILRTMPPNGLILQVKPTTAITDLDLVTGASGILSSIGALTLEFSADL